MYYSDEVIDEVISRNDIVNVISGYVSLRKKGRTFEACCPFHHEKTPSFKVDRDKQLYHCFGCGAGGNVFTFIMEYENMSFPEAVQYLADKAGMTLPESNQSGQDASREKYKILLRDMNKTAAAYFHYIMRHTEHGKKAYEYFKGRGLSDETINQFGLGYADIYRDDLYRYLKGKGYTDAELKDSGLVVIDEKNGGSDKFWNRAMIPILDINGKVIGFGGRVMGDGKPKYINTSDTVVFDKSRNLFAMNIARRSRRKGFICCEGYMDVISMHQAGFDNAVASLGTAFTFGHANILKRYTNEVYLAYDSDGAGVAATLKVISIMREVGISARVINMRPHKDPDEFIRTYGRDRFEAVLEGKARGFQQIVQAAGSSEAASNLLVTEQLTKIVELQSGAIKGLKFDKVVVMGNGGNSSVGGFVQNLVTDTLPLHELGKSVGLELPAFLGKPMEGKTAASSPAPAADAPAADTATTVNPS